MSCAGEYSEAILCSLHLTLKDTTEIDHTFPLPFRRRAEDILLEVKANYHFQVFAGVAHGFAVRGDPEVDQTRKCVVLPASSPSIHIPASTI